MVGGWKRGRIEKILISLIFVWLRVKKWRDRKNEKGCCLVRGEGEENFWWDSRHF